MPFFLSSVLIVREKKFLEGKNSYYDLLQFGDIPLILMFSFRTFSPTPQHTSSTFYNTKQNKILLARRQFFETYCDGQLRTTK